MAAVAQAVYWLCGWAISLKLLDLFNFGICPRQLQLADWEGTHWRHRNKMNVTAGDSKQKKYIKISQGKTTKISGLCGPIARDFSRARHRIQFWSAVRCVCKYFANMDDDKYRVPVVSRQKTKKNDALDWACAFVLWDSTNGETVDRSLSPEKKLELHWCYCNLSNIN